MAGISTNGGTYISMTLTYVLSSQVSAGKLNYETIKKIDFKFIN